MQSAFQGLPEELLVKIFKQLAFAERRSVLPLVCKEFHQLTERSTDLWASVTLNDSEEGHAFRTLQRAGLTGGVLVSETHRRIVKRVTVLQWFQKHSSVISEVSVACDCDSDAEADIMFDIKVGGLTAMLLGVRETLTHLSVTDSGLIKSQPFLSDLSWLASLRVLDLDNYDGENEADIEALTCLTDLQTLKLEGGVMFPEVVFPESFFSLTQLKFLRIAAVAVGGFFEGFSSLVGLTTLEFEEILRGGADIAEHVVTLSGLVRLQMENCRLIALPEMKTLRSLKELDVNTNAFETFSFRGLSGLTLLNVGNCHLVGFPDLGQMRSLKKLFCHRNNFSEFPVAQLMRLAGSIEELHFRYCTRMEIPESIVHMAYT